ncbi:DUF4395 domain-containing protein [Dinghuibacter silviterrae]|uniref:Uncharacterized protein DUF4395 n=1 Tax=Dinghuibacter silviterrae TaxID=1539049 RepID=A0A4V3GKN4_9BACT|nr:DUF4395 domain-containing protein [Dinghuibacter silviterrae]TDW96242.1 uncharacterized protein DUF4395 [Dinghuibacter silviterrae]
MSKPIQFGEDVPGYQIRVLNEREIRAAAGILFLATFTSIMLIFFQGNFRPVKYVVTLFFLDFIIRVFISPRFAPTLILGRWIVSRQVPEYVGARQKRFAWAVGLALSATIFVFLVVVNAYSPITGLACMACLVFLYFESVFGICIACKMYTLFFRKKAQYCPGEVCDVKTRQKITAAQWLVMAAFILGIVALVYFFNGYYNRQPYDLFGINTPTK